MSQNEPPHDGRNCILTGSFLIIIVIVAAFGLCLFSSCTPKMANDLIKAIELEQKFEKDARNAS